ncbi:unnamed protein product [Calypogeia fissa]
MENRGRASGKSLTPLPGRTLEGGEEFFVGKGLPEAGKEDLKKLLSEYKDVFAWSHQDLTGILPKYGEHRIDLKEEARPVRQSQYRFNPKYSLKIKDELDQLLAAGFIYPVNNSEWVSPL